MLGPCVSELEELSTVQVAQSLDCFFVSWQVAQSVGCFFMSWQVAQSVDCFFMSWQVAQLIGCFFMSLYVALSVDCFFMSCPASVLSVSVLWWLFTWCSAHKSSWQEFLTALLYVLPWPCNLSPLFSVEPRRQCLPAQVCEWNTTLWGNGAKIA